MDTSETWQSIPSFPGYEASSHGRIRSPRGIVSPAPKRTGHLQVSLRRDGVSMSRTVGLLINEAFHGPRPRGLVTRHLNGDPSDNRPDNLVYGTQSENVLDSVRHGTHLYARRDTCKHGHPFDGRNKRQRTCSICLRAATARHRAAHGSSPIKRSDT